MGDAMLLFKQTAKAGLGRWAVAAVVALSLGLSACGSGSATGADAANNAGNTNGSVETQSSTDATNGSSTATATSTGTNTGTAAGTGGTTGSTPTSPTTPSTPTTPTTPPTGGTVSTEVYTITVYYTAVESFHTDAAQNVTGCLTTTCSFGNSVIGSYPASFIKATKTEGTGRITSGANAGKYLNWSVDVGYWLDTIPSDGYGGALVPFRTAAADAIALPRGAQFRLVGPLKQEDGSALDAGSASRFLAATWLINDQFTPGLGGALHLDVYIGEEDRVNFTNSAMYTTLANVKITRL